MGKEFITDMKEQDYLKRLEAFILKKKNQNKAIKKVISSIDNNEELKKKTM